MAKAIGLIGNYTGKLGNTVGYNLKDSNNKQTQGVRVYQPVVKNPKTAAQAEQRAKLAPINATYRVLKNIIDRGQEGVAYGNKSRLAWLKNALKEFNGAWYDKNAEVKLPAWVALTRGTLPRVRVSDCGMNNVTIVCAGLEVANAYATIGAFSTAVLALKPEWKSGDQLTIVVVHGETVSLQSTVISIVLDPHSDEPTPVTITPAKNSFKVTSPLQVSAAAAILSREGDNGEHLRSTSYFLKEEDMEDDRTGAEAKNSAIASYMAAGANTDWAEESIM